MANTTNFGWETPDDTDLVKDGAAAIRTLGSAIDTSLVDLKGGTTGQVLSKASNTDMDFTWVAQDDSNAIQNALLTTTGDTIYASSAATPARLGIGTTGQVLTVSAGGIPSWATSATGSRTLLSTTTLSGATVTISSIDQNYQSLFAVIYGVTNATATGTFKLSPNNAGSCDFINVRTSVLNLSAGGDAELTGTSTNGSLYTNANNVWILQIDNYTSTTNHKTLSIWGRYTNDGGTKRGYFLFGGIEQNSAITSLVFSNAGGNLSTGTVLLYGVK